MSSGNLLFEFWPEQNEPPTSNAATPSKRNGHGVLEFSDSVDQEAIFKGVLSHSYNGGGVDVKLGIMAKDPTVTPHNLIFQAAFELLTGQDLDTDHFSAFQSSGAVQEADASGKVAIATIHFDDGAEMSSIAGKSPFRLKIRCDADGTSGTYTLTDLAQFLFGYIVES